MTDILVTAVPGATTGQLQCGTLTFPCVIGRGSIVAADAKREGDGATPIGTFPLRQVYWRPDRVAAPATTLPTVALMPAMGWCDESGNAHYNREVALPFAASHEELWRDDHVYDLIAVIGWNDDPVVPGKGSAIFLHLCQPDHAPTAGCVAMTEAEMRTLLRQLTPTSTITIRPAA